MVLAGGLRRLAAAPATSPATASDADLDARDRAARGAAGAVPGQPRRADAPAALAVLDRVARAVAPAAALTPSLRTGALEPAGDGPDAACALALAIVFAARADGSFARLKACPHAHCGWAFYDGSRNRSGQWCSMRICGNRTKGEAFRRRQRAPREPERRAGNRRRAAGYRHTAFTTSAETTCHPEPRRHGRSPPEPLASATRALACARATSSASAWR